MRGLRIENHYMDRCPSTELENPFDGTGVFHLTWQLQGENYFWQINHYQCILIDFEEWK